MRVVIVNDSFLLKDCFQLSSLCDIDFMILIAFLMDSIDAYISENHHIGCSVPKS